MPSHLVTTPPRGLYRWCDERHRRPQGSADLMILWATPAHARRVALVVFTVLFISAGPVPASGQTSNEPAPLPGNGRTVQLGRATWDTGWFQAAILSELLTDLGYVVDGPHTYTNEEFYSAIGGGAVDLWANGWFPLHERFLSGNDAASAIGTQVAGGAIQGYLVDRATAERLQIRTLSDLGDPVVAAEFDHDGDGLADLIGCERTWSCHPVIEHHLAELGLTDSVRHADGSYTPNMLDVVSRYDAGEPILFYTFTPNWTLGALRPGEDVVWLTAEEATDPQSGVVAPASGELPGCPANPCPLGFAPNDIQFVADNELLADEPAIASLLDAIRIPLDDIATQNAELIRGRDSESEIAAHALNWIEANSRETDDWIEQAIESHLDAGRRLFPAPVVVDARQQINATLRVVTRIESPYVTYDGAKYGGFSIEVIDLIASDLGTDIDVYAVNSSAKLVDDIARGAADVGIGALTVTAEREERVDFTQPYLDFELAIASQDQSSGFLGGKLKKIAGTLFSLDVLALLLFLVFLLIVAGHVIWFTERADEDSDFSPRYREGIWEGFWWAAVTATTVGYGDKTPKGRGGRIFGLIWMFSGLFVLAYFTAGVAAAFTVDEITADVTSVSDLRGRSVAVPADSPANEFLASQGIPATVFTSATQAYEALDEGDVDAMVHDAVAVRHLVVDDQDGGVLVTAVIPAEVQIGFAVNPESELLEALNHSLLELVEQGRYAELKARWLGSES